MPHFVIQTDGENGVLLVDGEQPDLFGRLVGAEIRQPPPGAMRTDPNPYAALPRSEPVIEVTLRLPIGPNDTLTIVQGSRMEDIQGPTADYRPDAPHPA